MPGFSSLMNHLIKANRQLLKRRHNLLREKYDQLSKVSGRNSDRRKFNKTLADESRMAIVSNSRRVMLETKKIRQENIIKTLVSVVLTSLVFLSLFWLEKCA